MKNKIEFKRAMFCSFCVIIFFNIIMGITIYYQYKTYTKNFNTKINGIITELNQIYPNLEMNDILEILNKPNSNENILLKNYGIDLNQDSVILENENCFVRLLVLNLTLITTFSIIILVIFLRYNRKKDRKLNEITKYIEEINNKNYKLDIDDNTEDELAILKNEVYKTTIMLKEIAENSMKDKVNLKDSLSDISHQLKTPLTSITIMLDNILDNPEMNIETRSEFLKDIKREIINVNFLVNSLLKLSKLDANSVNFINEEVYIETLIQESIKNVSVLCDLKNIEINVEGNKSSKIYCDLKWQVEAITNILKNCIEHSNMNSKIDISYQKNKMDSKIEIKDYGIGIDEKELPHIFERFYKGKNSSSESVGIGLALAKSIIENNNGYIGVKSKKNIGTTFTIKYFEM